ncbi:hypothetical protein HK100_001379 [Physocladia obscura]|uniref:Uncharacterized protein n=1 Tax=Physocladia obscura TaxID=109957 RepID=A0AAD5TAN9_9FUNG|nr:hypothetical protein HK100_001379 [Physocladia obscura]
MGATESKVSFRKGVYALTTGKTETGEIVDATYVAWFVAQTALADDTEDIFNFLGPKDIRQIRDGQPHIFEQLVERAAKVLIAAALSSALPPTTESKDIDKEKLNKTINEFITETKPEDGNSSVNNGIAFEIDTDKDVDAALVAAAARLLTRVLPFVHEQQGQGQGQGRPGVELEQQLFWPAGFGEGGEGAVEKQGGLKLDLKEEKRLGARLVSAVLHLLFVHSLTLAPSAATRLWARGIACPDADAPPQSAQATRARIDLLRLLQALLSAPVYRTPDALLPLHQNNLNQNQIQQQLQLQQTYSTRLMFASILCSASPQSLVQGLMVSLLNSIFSANLVGFLPYNHLVFSATVEEHFVLLAAQVLVLLLDLDNLPARRLPRVDVDIVHDALQTLAQSLADSQPQSSDRLPTIDDTNSNTNPYNPQNLNYDDGEENDNDEDEIDDGDIPMKINSDNVLSIKESDPVTEKSSEIKSKKKKKSSNTGSNGATDTKDEKVQDKEERRRERKERKERKEAKEKKLKLKNSNSGVISESASSGAVSERNSPTIIEPAASVTPAPTPIAIPTDSTSTRESPAVAITSTTPSSPRAAVSVVVPTLSKTPPNAAAAFGNNDFRYFLSRIANQEDLKFIWGGIVRLLRNPLEASSTMFPGSTKKVGIHIETMMLFWKLYELNSNFAALVKESDKTLSLLAALVYFMNESKANPNDIGVTRLTVFILHILSQERSFSILLNQPFEASVAAAAANSLPIFPAGSTWADFLVLSYHSIITSTSKTPIATLHETMLMTLANMSAYWKSLSVVTVNKLMNLFNSIVQYQISGNSQLVYALVRNREKIHALDSLTFDVAFNELNKIREAKAKRLAEEGVARASSEKKFLPSPEWFNYWKSHLRLQILVTLVEALYPSISQFCIKNESNDEMKALEYLQSGTTVGLLPLPQPLFTRKFTYTDAVRVWFTSYMWGNMYIKCANPIGGAEILKYCPSIWTNTDVKLFGVRINDE